MTEKDEAKHEGKKTAGQIGGRGSGGHFQAKWSGNTRHREQKGREREKERGDPVARAHAASCENRLMMQPAAELHRVLLGTSTRHMPHCCAGPSVLPSSHFPYTLLSSPSLTLSAATRRAPFEAREINVRLVARRFSGSSATNHRRTDGRRRRRVRRQEENEENSGSSRLTWEGTRARILLRECATLLSALFVIPFSRTPRL